MTNKKKDVELNDTLIFCGKLISEQILDYLESINSQDKINVNDDVYQKYHILLKHRHNIDQLIETL